MNQAISRRLTPNQIDRRQRILDATRDMIAQQGYGGMVMRDVADKANVSPTTLYNLYNTKDELLLAALRDAVTEGWDEVTAQVAELGLDQILLHVSYSVKQTRREPEYARAITQALLRANQGDTIVEVLFEGMRKALHASLQTMQTQNELNAQADVERLATALMGAFWGVYSLWSKDIIDIEVLEAEMRRSFLGLISPAMSGPRAASFQAELQTLTNH